MKHSFNYSSALNITSNDSLYIGSENPHSLKFVGLIYDFLWIRNDFLYNGDNFDSFNEPDLSNLNGGEIILRLKGSNYLGTLSNSISPFGDMTTSIIIPSIACFGKSAKILCFVNNEEKYINIFYIQKNDIVKTYLYGYIKVKDILKCKKINYNNTLSKMFVLKKNKIQYNVPFEDLIVIAGHSILVDNLSENEKIKQSKFWNIEYKIDDKYLLLSCVSDLFEELSIYDNDYIYHILLDCIDINKHFGIYANGILTESISENVFNTFKSNYILCDDKNFFSFTF